MSQNLKQLLIYPINKRSQSILSKIIDLLKDIKYFHDIAHLYGNKIIYQYCKFVEITSISPGCVINHLTQFLVIIQGNILSRHRINHHIVSQYCRGQQLKQLDQTLQYYVKQETQFIKIRYQYIQKLKHIQKSAFSQHQKRLETIKKNSELSQIISSMNISSFFQDIPFFDLVDMTFHSKLKYFRKGQTVYSQGYYPTCIFYLVNGQVRINHRQRQNQAIYIYGNNKKNFQILSTTTINANQFFGIQQVIEQKSYECQALAYNHDVRIAIIQIDRFQQKINKLYTPKILEHLINLINIRKNLAQNLKLSKLQQKKIYQQNVESTNAQKLLKQRIGSMKQKTYDQKSGFLRSRRTNLNYQHYLPANIFHKNSNVLSKYTIYPSEDQDLGLFQKDFLKKQHQKTIQLSSYSSSKNTPTKPQRKHIYQRVIISRLQQYDNLDQSKYFDSIIERQNPKGSTINFFKKNKTQIKKHHSLKSRMSKSLKDKIS